MHIASPRKVRGSIMLAVPPAILDLLRLKAGSRVGLEVHRQRLVIQAAPQTKTRPKYTLDELLSQWDARAGLKKTKFKKTKKDRAWIDLAPVGREL